MIIKGEFGSELQINILRRSNEDTDDYWDGNWLEVEIKAQIKGFRCIYGTNLRIDELESFNADLLKIYDDKKDEAEFTTMEEGLYLYFKKEYNGIISCRGIAKDDAENSLNFKFDFDLTSLAAFMKDLSMNIGLYPLKGEM